jgi:DTW domain-containing protein YfiP
MTRILSFFVLLVATSSVNAFPSPFFLDNDVLFLSDLISSPERYAQALNMTVEQMSQQKLAHQKASDDLHHQLQSKELCGTEKHQRMCSHYYRYGRHPFTCRNCWSYLPVCICHQTGPKRPLPANLKVAIWTHHREWGLTSNTGSIVAQALENCDMLMKGLQEHDIQLQDNILEDDKTLAVVLWPDSADSSAPSISLEQVQQELKHRRVVLIAVDGTWKNARRMVYRLPDTLPRLDLPVDVVLSSPETGSILAPLRTRGGPSTREGSDRQACTAEAVVGALVALGLSKTDGEHVLELTKTKVDRIRRYRGKV